MSWLIAALMPALLMGSAFAMQRLESVMHGDRPSAGQVVALLEQAAHAARENAAQRTLNDLAGLAQTNGHPGRLDAVLLADEPGLPTRPNPMFPPSEIANPV
jgi:hypothetical protein